MSKNRNLADLLDSTGDVKSDALDNVSGLPDAIDVNASAPADSLNVDASGNVGIGTSSPDGLLHLKSTSPFIKLEDTDAGGSYHQLGNSSSDGTLVIYADAGNNKSSTANLRFNVSGTERMRITSEGIIRAGNLNQKLGSGASFVSLSGNGYATLRVRRGADTGNAVLFYGSNSSASHVGSIDTSSSSTSYNTSSDYRLKENVVDMTGAIDRVKALQPKRFNYIADADTTIDGFLAHEVSSTVPEAISGTHNEVDEDGNPVYQGIDQSKLVPLLTGALQEAIAKIEALETTVADLTTRIEALENV